MIYEYQCAAGHVTMANRPVAERHNDKPCDICQGKTNLKISTPHLAPILGGGDFPGYHCPVSDQYVTSKKQRREIMSRHDVVEAG